MHGSNMPVALVCTPIPHATAPSRESGDCRDFA
jgi:hypothetical protein